MQMRFPRDDSLVWLTHGHVTLALHQLAEGSGLPLLLLHALHSSHAEWRNEDIRWPGPVHALDFCGHGRSDHLRGGGYYPELLAADADVALATIGRSAVAGAGLGAYVALLLAGSRPDLVTAALLLPGCGLAGAGPDPAPEHTQSWTDFDALTGDAAMASDPYTRILEREVRPPDYARSFARAARKILVADGVDAPPWGSAVAALDGIERVSALPHLAIARLAAIVA